MSTRLLTKPERATQAALTVDTHRAVTVVLAGSEAAPQGAPAGVHRYAGTLATQGRRIAVVVDWDPAQTQCTFGLDADADGKLAPAELRRVAVRGGNAAGSPAPAVSRLQLDQPLVCQIAGRDYGLQVRRYEDVVWRAEFVADVDYRLGDVQLDGVRHTLLVIDCDDDARFATAGDVFAFLPATQFATVPGFGAGRGFTFLTGDAAILGDRRVRLASVDDAGVARLTVQPAHEPLGDELSRRHARALAAHKLALADRAAAFEQENGLAPTAPNPEAKIDWLWTLDATEALARAKAKNQPLFLLYENETDERCAQMDIYVWDHPKVVAAARGFVCARVAIELDLARTATRYGVRLGPAYVFCAPDGRPLEFLDRRTGRPVQMTKGFKSPAEMAALLVDSLDRLAQARFDPPPRTGK